MVVPGSTRTGTAWQDAGVHVQFQPVGRCLERTENLALALRRRLEQRQCLWRMTGQNDSIECHRAPVSEFEHGTPAGPGYNSRRGSGINTFAVRSREWCNVLVTSTPQDFPLRVGADAKEPMVREKADQRFRRKFLDFARRCGPDG